jgi:hypothetical protein
MSWLKRLVALFWSVPETHSAVVNTKQPAQPSTPAKAKRKYVRKAAPSTKAVASRKPAQKAAKRGQTGKSAATPARKTRQHAK